MLRLILILLIITALSLGLAWIADEPGRVAIDWADYHLETSLLVLVAAVAVSAAVLMSVYAFVYLIVRAPIAWRRARLAKRQAMGLEALTETFAAIATQDVLTAKRRLTRAQHYLPHQPITLMLAMQVARMEGNESQARLYLEQMSHTGVTEFMALRGLIEAHRRSGDNTTALRHAERALAIKPQDRWLLLTLIGLYAKAEQTQHALRLLEQSARRRYIDRQEMRQWSAYVLYENARMLAGRQRQDFAIAMLEDVLRKSPGFVPATVLLAQLYLKQGEVKRALKLIGNAWKNPPHPDLTTVLMRCYDAKVERSKVVQTAQKLARTYPEAEECLALSALLAMHEDEREASRRIIAHMLENAKTARVCRLMAELETLCGNLEEADRWEALAGSAPAPAWTCDSCSHTTEMWQLACPHCGSVASIAWK